MQTIDSHIPDCCTHHDTEASPIHKSALREAIPPKITFQPQVSALTKGPRLGKRKKKKPRSRFQKHLCRSKGMLNVLLKTAMGSRPTALHYQVHFSDITLCPSLSVQAGKVKGGLKKTQTLAECL